MSCPLIEIDPTFVTRPPSWDKGNTGSGRLIDDVMWQQNTDYDEFQFIIQYIDGGTRYINRHVRSLNTAAAGWPALSDTTALIVITWSNVTLGGSICNSHRIMFLRISNLGFGFEGVRFTRDNELYAVANLDTVAQAQEPGARIQHPELSCRFLPGLGVVGVARTNSALGPPGLWAFLWGGETEDDVNLSAAPVALKISTALPAYAWCIGRDRETGNLVVADNSSGVIHEVAPDLSSVVSTASVLPSGQSATVYSVRQPALLFGGRRIGFCGVRTGGFLQNFLEYEKNVDGDWAFVRNTNVGLGIGGEGQTTEFNVALDDCLVYHADEQYVYSYCAEDCCGLANIDETVYDLARRAGIPSNRIDLSGIATDSDFGSYWGMGVGRPATARNVVEILQRFAFFDLADIGGKIIASRRDRLPDGTIGGDDLRGHAYGETPPTLARRERDEDYELPRAVRVNYSQSLAEYEPGTESYSRRVTDADMVVDIDLTAIAMDPDEAAAIAEIATLEQIVMREATDVTLVATEANKALIPGDIKTLDVRGRLDTVRITEMGYAYPGLLNLKLKRHDPSIYVSDATGGGRTLLGSVLYAPGPTEFALLDAPLVREHDDEYGYFAALGGNPSFPGLVEGWPGGDLERLEPAGWEDIVRVLRPGCAFGTCTTALPDAGANYVTANTLQMTLNGVLESATLAEICLGANLAAVRAGTGWELIRFTTASVSGATWTISGIVRGVHGTEWATGLHVIGDQFILLSGQQQVLTSIDQLNRSWQHNAATLGFESDPANVVAFAWTGVDRIPYSPAHLGAERNVGDDLILTWTRRDRVGQELQSGATLPLSEATESYEVDIYNALGTTVLRTITSATPTATYTAAQQTTDFGSLPASLDWDVRQMGELGRGYARRITSEGL